MSTVSIRPIGASLHRNDGGLMFCTTHFVQDHCSMDELAFAYDVAYRLVRELGTG